MKQTQLDTAFCDYCWTKSGITWLLRLPGQCSSYWECPRELLPGFHRNWLYQCSPEKYNKQDVCVHTCVCVCMCACVCVEGWIQRIGSCKCGTWQIQKWIWWVCRLETQWRVAVLDQRPSVTEFLLLRGGWSLFCSGFKLIEWVLPTMGRAIDFTQSSLI